MTPGKMIPLCDVEESAENPRKTWGDLAELAANVREVGILQPLLVRPRSPGFEIVFGHRRYRAAKLAGLAAVPCMVRDLSDLQAAEIRCVENLQREDVHPLEEAEGYELLRDKHRMSVEEIAAKVGKSKAYIFARIKLLELCPDARKASTRGRPAVPRMRAKCK